MTKVKNQMHTLKNTALWVSFGFPITNYVCQEPWKGSGKKRKPRGK